MAEWFEMMRGWFRTETPPTVLLPPQPIHERACPCCGQTVTIWRTYAAGHIRCVGCADEGR